MAGKRAEIVSRGFREIGGGKLLSRVGFVLLNPQPFSPDAVEADFNSMSLFGKRYQ